MAYRIAICDDEAPQRAYLSNLIGSWARERGHAADIACFPSAEAFLFDYDDKEYDILLLDIEMGAMNGVELARRVRTVNKEVQLVFVTGYTEYIADGYEVEALHYLIKPVTPEKLTAVLERAAERLRRNERALLLDLGGETVRVPLHTIRSMEVQRNYVTVHAAEPHTVKATLSELEKSLDERFLRVGRSFIVNLAHVSRVTKTDIRLTDGTSLPLPRGQYDAVNRALIEHT